MSEHHDMDEAFIAGISATLRAEERVPADFESRVMSDVRAIRGQLTLPPAFRRPWLTRPMTFSVSPLAGLAMAAGLALLLFGGARLARGPAASSTPAAVATRTDTLHVVRFVLAERGATSIALVGSFNQWKKDATPMTEVAPGIWSVQLPLTADRHEYAFVVRDDRGERWIADPSSTMAVRDEFGAESSVIDLTSPSTS